MPAKFKRSNACLPIGSFYSTGIGGLSADRNVGKIMIPTIDRRMLKLNSTRQAGHSGTVSSDVSRKGAPFSPSSLEVQKGRSRQVPSTSEAHTSISPDSGRWGVPASASKVAPKESLDLMKWLSQRKKLISRAGEKTQAINLIKKANGDFKSVIKTLENKIESPHAQCERKTTTLQGYLRAVRNLEMEWEEWKQQDQPIDAINHTDDMPSTLQSESGRTDAINLLLENNDDFNFVINDLQNKIDVAIKKHQKKSDLSKMLINVMQLQKERLAAVASSASQDVDSAMQVEENLDGTCSQIRAEWPEVDEWLKAVVAASNNNMDVTAVEPPAQQNSASQFPQPEQMECEHGFSEDAGDIKTQREEAWNLPADTLKIDEEETLPSFILNNDLDVENRFADFLTSLLPADEISSEVGRP